MVGRQAQRIVTSSCRSAAGAGSAERSDSCLHAAAPFQAQGTSPSIGGGTSIGAIMFSAVSDPLGSWPQSAPPGSHQLRHGRE